MIHCCWTISIQRKTLTNKLPYQYISLNMWEILSFFSFFLLMHDLNPWFHVASYLCWFALVAAEWAQKWKYRTWYFNNSHLYALKEVASPAGTFAEDKTLRSARIYKRCRKTKFWKHLNFIRERRAACSQPDLLSLSRCPFQAITEQAVIETFDC